VVWLLTNLCQSLGTIGGQRVSLLWRVWLPTSVGVDIKLRNTFGGHRTVFGQRRIRSLDGRVVRERVGVIAVVVGVVQRGGRGGLEAQSGGRGRCERVRERRFGRCGSRRRQGEPRDGAAAQAHLLRRDRGVRVVDRLGARVVDSSSPGGGVAPGGETGSDEGCLYLCRVILNKRRARLDNRMENRRKEDAVEATDGRIGRERCLPVHRRIVPCAGEIERAVWRVDNAGRWNKVVGVLWTW
jgi:hypothetical protein